MLKPSVRYAVILEYILLLFYLIFVKTISLNILFQYHFLNFFFFSRSTSSALAKLTKASTSGASLKQQEGEKKETPQERLKRIMSRQLNKQSMSLKLCIF